MSNLLGNPKTGFPMTRLKSCSPDKETELIILLHYLEVVFGGYESRLKGFERNLIVTLLVTSI